MMIDNFDKFDGNHGINEEYLFESLGGRLTGVFDDLKDMTASLGSASKIEDSDIGDLLKAVGDLEAKYKKILKGKGIIGW